MKRYTALNNQVQFNPEAYVLEWEKLAADFEAEERSSMANGCRGKASWYRGVGKGYAQQLSYVDVTDVPVDGVATKDERVLPCIVCDTFTKHTRLTDGWMCGCGEFIRTILNV